MPVTSWTTATVDDDSCVLPVGCETCSGATDGTGTIIDNDADNDAFVMPMKL